MKKISIQIKDFLKQKKNMQENLKIKLFVVLKNLRKSEKIKYSKYKILLQKNLYNKN